ncbi:hypothetical protein P4391_33210 [Bacillus thuringiensis]|uniref:Uncharacterized protein n=1 Tax=Bacillus thuringiensis serovar toumanoffi TaxID=180862 RepID=A0ABD5I254_BACTU|nr:hypothetical protein [Bacillus thuringiensis]MDW9211290.1 hypothetical protein [Bacillus thuringiensis serovar toumanoffi]MED3219124.1 hypothetical protein [Bacillus thuringiensis]MED3244516.1 hypothetical protein [Bacillus thuringiensis]MED3302172.1 hypothetical protein [Bacillus thuringiensis]MED3594425.1 hypothetical protein [Bacillus thuringiensis]
MIESHQLIVTIPCDVTIEQLEPDEKTSKDNYDVYMYESTWKRSNAGELFRHYSLIGRKSNE